jgi:hypothetical protein
VLFFLSSSAFVCATFTFQITLLHAAGMRFFFRSIAGAGMIACMSHRLLCAFLLGAACIRTHVTTRAALAELKPFWKLLSREAAAHICR